MSLRIGICFPSVKNSPLIHPAIRAVSLRCFSTLPSLKVNPRSYDTDPAVLIR
jgi:hypothetical protein